MKEILNMLQAIIAENGLEYPAKEPYLTYQTLLEKGVDAQKARLILLTLAANIPEKAKGMSQEELSKAIQQECYLKRKPSEALAALYLKLYSPAPQPEPDLPCEDHFPAFCEGTWKLDWKGEAIWPGDCYSMKCIAAFTADVIVEDRDLAHKAVAAFLKDNPGATAEAIWGHMHSVIAAKQDEYLHWFATVDTYYKPSMDIYGSNAVMDLWKDLSEMGLEIVEDSDDYHADLVDV